MKLISGSLILTCLFFLGCSKGNKTSCVVDAQIMKQNDSLMLKMNKEDQVFFDYMNEVRLVDLKHPTIRLVISQSFGDTSSLVFTISNLENGLRIKRRTIFRDDCKADLVKVITSHKKYWDVLSEKFENECFWTQRVWDNHSGLDGNTYSIEYYSPDNMRYERDYFRIVRWSPKENTVIKKLSSEIIRVVDMSENELRK